MPGNYTSSLAGRKAICLCKSVAIWHVTAKLRRRHNELCLGLSLTERRLRLIVVQRSTFIKVHVVTGCPERSPSPANWMVVTQLILRRKLVNFISGAGVHACLICRLASTMAVMDGGPHGIKLPTTACVYKCSTVRTLIKNENIWRLVFRELFPSLVKENNCSFNAALENVMVKTCKQESW